MPRDLRQQSELGRYVRRRSEPGEKVRISRKATEADPKNVNARIALARAYLRIGEILEMKPEPMSALENYRKALAIEETLSRSDLSNETARERVAMTLNHLARLEARAGLGRGEERAASQLI